MQSPSATGPANTDAERAEALQLWAKKQPGGAVAILILNMFKGKPPVSVTVDFEKDLNLTHSAAVLKIRDIWKHKDVGTARNLTVEVPAHDSRFYLLTPRATRLR